MPVTDQELKALEKKAHDLRRLCVDTVNWAGSGHIGGASGGFQMGAKKPGQSVCLGRKRPSGAFGLYTGLRQAIPRYHGGNIHAQSPFLPCASIPSTVPWVSCLKPII